MREKSSEARPMRFHGESQASDGPQNAAVQEKFSRKAGAERLYDSLPRDGRVTELKKRQ